MNGRERLEVAASYLEGLSGLREYGRREAPVALNGRDGLSMNLWGVDIEGDGGEPHFVGCVGGWLTRCEALRDEGLAAGKDLPLREGYFVTRQSRYCPTFGNYEGFEALAAFFEVPYSCVAHIAHGGQDANLERSVSQLRALARRPEGVSERDETHRSPGVYFDEGVSLVGMGFLSMVAEIIDLNAKLVRETVEEEVEPWTITLTGEVARGSAAFGAPFDEDLVGQTFDFAQVAPIVPRDYLEDTRAHRREIASAFSLPPDLIGSPPDDCGVSVEEASRLLLLPFKGRTYSEAEILDEMNDPPLDSFVEDGVLAT